MHIDSANPTAPGADRIDSIAKACASFFQDDKKVARGKVGVLKRVATYYSMTGRREDSSAFLTAANFLSEVADLLRTGAPSESIYGVANRYFDIVDSKNHDIHTAIDVIDFGLGKQSERALLAISTFLSRLQWEIILSKLKSRNSA